MTRKAVVVIADDEPLARRALRGHLATLDWMGEVHEAGDGLAAIRAVDAVRPQILFLDIVMPGLSGLAVVEQITHRPYIVFTTAYEKYAVTAFEIGALDFLLKPFGRDRVRACRGRGRAAIEPAYSRCRAGREALGVRPITRVFVKERGRVIAVPLTPSARGGRRLCDAARRRAAAPDPRATPDLGDPPRSSRFVRIHRSHVVNLICRRDRAAFRPACGRCPEKRCPHRRQPPGRRASRR